MFDTVSDALWPLPLSVPEKPHAVLYFPFCMNVPWPKKYQVNEPLPLNALPQVHAAGGNALALLDDALELTLVLLEVTLLDEADVESVLALVVAAVLSTDV